MIIDSLTFLLANYWTYMVGTLAIGLVAGWFSYAPRKR